VLQERRCVAWELRSAGYPVTLWFLNPLMTESNTACLRGRDGMIDPPREEAMQAVTKARDAGIRRS
jgi:hypothetical protein